MNTRPLRWYRFVKRFKRWLRSEFEEWIQAWQQSQTWGMGFCCLYCKAIVSKDAVYCRMCGRALHRPMPVVWPEALGPNTGPMLPIRQIMLPGQTGPIGPIKAGEWSRHYLKMVRPDLRVDISRELQSIRDKDMDAIIRKLRARKQA